MAAQATKMAPLLAILCVLSCNHFLSSSASSADDFLQCLAPTVPSSLVFTKNSSGFTWVLQSSIQNPKFASTSMARPLFIITASTVCHVQAAVRCGRRYGLRLRIRSGGHDYEALSYLSVHPEEFAVLDLARLRGVRVTPGEATAWVDAGTTLGELYYAVGTRNPGFAFPGGVCSTVGISGFLSGGGIGLTMRKFGVGGDNVVDARIVTANGEVLDRAAMGEDLFWAIRGGGGESFGVVVAWRLKLSKVPSTVTVLNIWRSLEQGAADLIAKWETTIWQPFLADLTIRVVMQGNQAFFQTLYLGRCSSLRKTMDAVFPELGMKEADCREMSWLHAMTFIGFSDTTTPVEVMLNRTNNLNGVKFKVKSDYARRFVGRAGWEAIFRQHLSRFGGGMIILEPHGAAVGGPNTYATSPYPHRRGVLFNLQYGSNWQGAANGTVAAAALSWLDGLYGFMAQFVSSNPREAFANYRDLEIGQNVVGSDGVSTYRSGRVWGERYFMGNFWRLAMVKGKVDPTDYFRNEQSIPPLRFN
jgi:hypothetical protein